MRFLPSRLACQLWLSFLRSCLGRHAVAISWVSHVDDTIFSRCPGPLPPTLLPPLSPWGSLSLGNKGQHRHFFMGSHIVDVLFAVVFSLIDIFPKFIKVLQVAWQLCSWSRQDILWVVYHFGMSLSWWRAGGMDCGTMDSLAHCSLYGEQAVLFCPGVGWSSFMSDTRTSGVSGACLCLSNGSPTRQWVKGPGHLSSTSKPSSSGYYSLRHGGLALKWFLTAQISKPQIFKQPLIHTDLEK